MRGDRKSCVLKSFLKEETVDPVLAELGRCAVPEAHVRNVEHEGFRQDGSSRKEQIQLVLCGSG